MYALCLFVFKMIDLLKERELDMNELSTSKILKSYTFKFKKYRNIIKSEIITKDYVSYLWSGGNAQYNLLKNIQYIFYTT